MKQLINAAHVLATLSAIALVALVLAHARPVPYCGTQDGTAQKECIVETNGDTYVVKNGAKQLL